MRKLFTILYHPFFILRQNIFVLKETTTNPEIIDDYLSIVVIKNK